MFKTLRMSLLASSILLAGTAGVAQAQDRGQASATYQVKLTAQPLSEALRTLSRQTGLEIVFRPELVRGRNARAVSGQLSAQNALDRLLLNSGLVVRYANGTAFLERAPAQRQPVALVAPVSAAATVGASEDNTSEIVVTGTYSASISDALDRKRSANNVVDSIEAVDIASFPSQNLAEALQRLPGVTIERDRGEGLFVKVRGLGANFQVTLLNGQSIAVNENVRDSGQSGRQFRFDTIPAELVAGVDVVKSPSANLEEGAIGGIVNIRTFKPLDLESGKFVVSAAGSYAEKADRVDPNFSTLASWKNDSATFGALIAATYSKRSTRQDRLTGIDWGIDKMDLDGDGTSDGEYLHPWSLRPTLEQEDRERYAVNAAVQFAPSDAVNLALEGFYTRLNDYYDELTYSVGFDPKTLVPGSAVIQDGVVVGGISKSDSQIGRDISDMVHQNWFVGLSGDIKAGGWTFHPKAYVTRALSDTAGPITRTRLSGPIGRVRLTMPKAESGAMPSVELLDSNLDQASLLPFRRIEWRPLKSIDKEHAYGLSVERPVNFGPFVSIDLGAKYRSRSRDYDRRDLKFETLKGKHFDGTYFNQFPFNDFLSSMKGSLPTSWVQPRPDPFWNESDTSAIASTEPTRADKRNSYQIDEEITSAYGMANFDSLLGSTPFRGNIGMRYAHTRQTSSGHAETGTEAVPVSFVTTYDDFLPSANLVVEPARNLILRFAAARVITRPSLADLAPRLTLNSSGLIFEANGGNPNLKRFQAWQYDAGVEYYFAPSSALIASVFYKDIGTFVYNQVTDFTVDGNVYKLTAPTNGGDAWVKGLELAFQHQFTFLPAPFDGLGLQANYTVTDSKATYSATIKDDLAGIAKHSYNLTGFYENGPFEAWLSYSWRGNVLQSVGTNNRLSQNSKAFGSVDGSLSLRVTDYAQISLQGINILNAKQLDYVDNNWLAGYTDYGRTVRLSARVSL
ncbi:TonB-dependent receptor [Novosphingobium mathurense]|uniref:TonB-dependent receptor n=2 Tax=Novosphingobium mathurense TaxID=428990 RepID=A0A1U6IWK3_9SPHN|nr:TonB-dependent receptor [Novosphingobium mathurense]